MMKILFICTGNTCRSVMAQQLAEHTVSKYPEGFEFASAGLCAREGAPFDPGASRALKAAGIAPKEHCARQLTTDMGNAADIIVCMNESQAQTLKIKFPYIETPIVFLKGTGDPLGGTPETYARSLDAIKRGVLPLLVTISPFSERDVDEVAEAERLCFSHPWRKEDFALAAENEAYIGFTARIGKRLAGYIFISELLGEAELLNIAVLPELRRNGIARLLMQKLCEVCEKRGASVCFLEVRSSNDGASKLYEDFGFKRIAIRKNYYEAPSEDAVIMRKEW